MCSVVSKLTGCNILWKLKKKKETVSKSVGRSSPPFGGSDDKAMHLEACRLAVSISRLRVAVEAEAAPVYASSAASDVHRHVIISKRPGCVSSYFRYSCAGGKSRQTETRIDSKGF
jgi:hypothetical protein